MKTADETLNKHIGKDAEPIPILERSDFYRKLPCPPRHTCIKAMEEHASLALRDKEKEIVKLQATVEDRENIVKFLDQRRNEMQETQDQLCNQVQELRRQLEERTEIESILQDRIRSTNKILSEKCDEAQNFWQQLAEYKKGVVYECNRDCPDAQYGACCHPDNCVKKIVSSDFIIQDRSDKQRVITVLKNAFDRRLGIINELKEKLKSQQKLTEELAALSEAALAWIDAVPKETPLPAMPGFDRDWANGTLEAYQSQKDKGKKEGGERELDFEVGDKFTTPETGDHVFTVTRFNKFDVEAIDYRSASGFGIFSKSHIKKIITK